jgi:enamine deaminase RidA (YjgF/YER057c/UK114 family)
VGNLLFLAGQGPFDVNGERTGETFQEQTRVVFDNLERVANVAGTSLKNAVRIGAFLSSLDYFEEFNTIMAEYVTGPYPARTTVPVSLTEFDIEVDAILLIPGKD